jgi:hypothetical protein
MPPFAVGQDVYGLAVPARLAQCIPDALDAVDDCLASGVNAGDTPGDAPPTICPVPAAAASPAPTHSPTNCSPLPVRVRPRRSTGYAAMLSCFQATPRQAGAPGPSLPHWCGACCVCGSAAPGNAAVATGTTPATHLRSGPAGAATARRYTALPPPFRAGRSLGACAR